MGRGCIRVCRVRGIGVGYDRCCWVREHQPWQLERTLCKIMQRQQQQRQQQQTKKACMQHACSTVASTIAMQTLY